jgi:alpha-galactosidase
LQDFPYILTPKPAETPRINGAKVFGVRPGSPFIFRIPATGIRPMTFAVESLPEGLSLDPVTGIITGKVSKAINRFLFCSSKANSVKQISHQYK